MEEVICYWIESFHISESLFKLSEYTDEVAELYEYSDWLKGDASSDTFVGLVKSIDETSFQAQYIEQRAQDAMSTVIEAAITAGAEGFKKYQKYKYRTQMPRLMDLLSENFDEIYTYNREEQIQSFYKHLWQYMDQAFIVDVG